MKIIYKATLKDEEVKYTNGFENIDGVEIQLLTMEDDLSILPKIKQKINSIHFPFCNKECYIHKILDNYETNDYLKKVIELSKEYECGVVLHNDYFLEEFIKNEKTEKFLEYLTKDKKIKLLIENVPKESPDKIGYRIEDTTLDTVKIINYINEKVGRKVCYPLLDTCHAMINICNSMEYPSYDYKSLISLYNSTEYNIHFNSIRGDGFGINHGLNFSENIPLMHKLLDEILAVNKDAILILEVREEDYNLRPNSKWLNGKIREYLTINSSRCKID